MTTKHKINYNGKSYAYWLDGGELQAPFADGQVAIREDKPGARYLGQKEPLYLGLLTAIRETMGPRGAQAPTERERARFAQAKRNLIFRPITEPTLKRCYDAMIGAALNPRSELYTASGLQRRGASHRCCFWDGFNGLKGSPTARIAGSLGQACFLAGKDFAKFVKVVGGLTAAHQGRVEGMPEAQEGAQEPAITVEAVIAWAKGIRDRLGSLEAASVSERERSVANAILNLFS